MKHKKLLTNLLFAAVVLAIAAVLLLVRSAHSSGSKLRAELIYGDNNTTMNLPLDKNDTYDVDTGYYTVHIEIKDGAARDRKSTRLNSSHRGSSRMPSSA